jgi:hypothetical protein
MHSFEASKLRSREAQQPEGRNSAGKLYVPFSRSTHRGATHVAAPADLSKALIKTYSALYFPNRFSCQKSRIPQLRVAAFRDCQTDGPFELFTSARYHIVTESTRLGIVYSMFGARRLLRVTVTYEDGCQSDAQHRAENLGRSFGSSGAGVWWS